MIRQAVLLCAGLGTRLRPFTENAPKAMVPILGTPMIEWNIRRFVQFGVKEFFINLHHLPEQLPSYLGDGSKWGVRIQYRYESDLLGTAGGVKNFESELDEEFFLIYGDIFSHLDYAAMETKWRSLPQAFGMQRVRRADGTLDADLAELDECRRIIAVHPKPHSRVDSDSYPMSGIFILRREVLSHVPAGSYSEIGKDLLPALIARNAPFWGYICEDFTLGVDNLNKRQPVEAYLSGKGIKSPAGLAAPHGRPI